MRLRFGLILLAPMVVGLPGGATAQSSASAAVRATVRPGQCPAHSRCDDNPGKGPKPKALTSAAASVADLLATLDVGTPTDGQPLRVIIRAPDARADEIRPAIDLPLELSGAVPQDMRARGPWLNALLKSAPTPDARTGLITVVVEY